MAVPAAAAPQEEPLGPPVAAAADALPTPPATTERVSVTDAEGQANGASGGVTALIASANGDQAISADGRWVAFVSFASNLTGGALPAGGLYLRDRQDGRTTAIPWLDGGPIPQGFIAAEPAISADGGVVAFTIIVSVSSSRILAATEPTPYVLAWDRATGVTEVVSFDDNGTAPAPGYQPTVSADGRYVAYTRWAPQVPATPPPTPTPRPNTAPSIFNLTASPTCIEPGNPSSTITVHASDPEGDAITVRIQLHWIDPFNNHFYRFPAAMTYIGGDTWTYVVTQDALQSYGWTGGAIHYNVTARDALGLDSATLTDDPSSTTNQLIYMPSGCTIL